MAAGISISALPNGNALTGTEQVPVVQNGVTIKVTTAQIAALGGGGGGGGGGTVTSVAVAANHGFTGTVALPSTTPAISISINGVAGLLKSDGTNLLSAVVGTDYVTPGLITASNLSANTARVLGRTTAGAGNIEEITIGSGLLLSAGTLVATASGGSVTTVSVATANGLAGTVATATTTPVITLRTSLTANVVKANGTALIAAVAATDYVGPGATTTSGLTMTTARILGRTTASTGAIEEITVGSGLSLSAGTLVATASGGSVTSVSVTTGNGFAGTVSTATSTPAILLSTTVTGLLKGNGTTISAAISGTDYYVPGGALGTPSSGVATNLTSIPASHLTGNVPITSLGSGTGASGSTAFFGDGTWKVVSSSGVPDFTAALTTAFNSNRFLDWPYGNVTLNAPILLISTAAYALRGVGFDMHGAQLICNFSDTSQDMVTCRGQGGAILGFNVRNTYFQGSFRCRNGLVLEALGSGGALNEGTIINCLFEGCNNDGLLLHGGVFEYYITSCSTNACLNGCELRQADFTISGQQVTSSIHFIGGDWRSTSHYGIATTADVAFQDMSGWHVTSCDFIGNGWPGLHAGGGGLTVAWSHFEATCSHSDSPSGGAITGTCFVPLIITACDGAHPPGGVGQNYLFEVNAGGAVNVTGSFNAIEGGATFAKLGRTAASGITVYVDGISGGSSGLIDGVGGSTLKTTNYSTSGI